MAFQPVNIYQETGNPRFLIICDHATNRLPSSYGTLGLAPEKIEQHIAYDLGALELAHDIGERVGCPVICAGFSRLLIDPNRALDDPTLIMKLSDGALIPQNRDVDARNDKAEYEKRIEQFYRPYHQAIDDMIDRALAQNIVPLMLSVHSFTPFYAGKKRPWQAAMLWDEDERLPHAVFDYMRRHAPDEAFGNNQPYSGKLHGDCMYQHGTCRGVPHGLIEIRQDICITQSGRHIWAKRLTQILRNCAALPTCNTLRAHINM